MFKQKKYHQNLKVVGNDIYSYNTLVGHIDHKQKKVIGHNYKSYSRTTTKHVNYVAEVLNYPVHNEI